MNFSKKLSLLFMIMALLAGCSAGVDSSSEDNPGVNSNGEISSANNPLQVKSLKVDYVDPIRDGGSQTANLIGKIYTIKACFQLKSRKQSLRNRNVFVDSVAKTTDIDGCIRWDHDFTEAYSKNLNCMEYEKVIQLRGTKATKTVRYTIDSRVDAVANLDWTRGCVQKELKQTISASNKSKQYSNSLILDTIHMFPNGELDSRRSDVKDMDYAIRFNTILVNKLTKDPITDTKVRVTVTNRDTGQKSVIQWRRDKDGNIDGHLRANWKGEISGVFDTYFEQYVYAHWMKNDFEVEVLEGPFKGQTIGRVVHLNPWEKDRYLFAIDDKEDAVNQIRDNPEPVNNRIHVDGVMYILIGNNVQNFKVNDYLGLTVNKTYQVVMNPRIDIGHRFTKDNPEDIKMKDGEFKLKFTIWYSAKGDMLINEKNFQDFEYITGAEKLVNVRNGIVNELVDLPIKVTDLPKLSMRTVAVVELAPVNDIKLRKSVVTGFFKAKIPWIKTNVMQNPSLNYDIKQHEEIVEKYSGELKNAQGRISTSIKNAKKAENDKVAYNMANLKNELNNDLPEEDNNYMGSSVVIDEHTPEEGYVINDSDYYKGKANRSIVEDKDYAKAEKLYEESQRKLKFRKFIEESFNNIGRYNGWKSDFNMTKDTPKELFVKNLKKQVPQTLVTTRNQAKRVLKLDISDKEFNSFFFKNGTRTHVRTDERIYVPVWSETLVEKICNLAFTTRYKQGHDRDGYILQGTKIMKARENISAAEVKESTASDYVTHCKSNPLKFFNLNAYRHVNKIKAIKPGASNGLSVHVGSRYNTNKSYSENIYYNLRWGIDSGLKLPMGDMLGGGLKIFDFAQGYSWNYSEGDQSGDQVAVDKSLAVEKYNVDITANFQRCIHVQGKKYRQVKHRGYTQYVTENIETPVQLYICDKPKDEVVTESWYYVQENFYGQSLLRDPYGMTEVRLVKVMRGEKNFTAFKERMETLIEGKIEEDQIAVESAENILYKSWSHIVDHDKNDQNKEKNVAKKVQEETEGSFPGTSF